jgi:hypothetical protein
MLHQYIEADRDGGMKLGAHARSACALPPHLTGYRQDMPASIELQKPQRVGSRA